MTDASLSFGVIDFGFVGEGPGAVHDVVEHAIACERVGYRRFWLGEHHDPRVSYTSPVLVAALVAARTSAIRIGIAGVLLRYYAPYRVFEELVDLERLFPGRIEAGVARGLTQEPISRRLGGPDAAAAFEGKLDELIELTAAARGTQPCPPLWLLGSSEASARRAAAAALPYSVSHFLSSDAAVEAAVAAYVRSGGRAVDVVIAVAGVCAPTRAAATAIAAEFVRSAVAQFKTAVIGAPEDWMRFVHRLRERTGAGGFSIQAMCLDRAARDEMFALLARAAGVTSAREVA